MILPCLALMLMFQTNWMKTHKTNAQDTRHTVHRRPNGPQKRCEMKMRKAQCKNRIKSIYKYFIIELINTISNTYKAYRPDDRQLVTYFKSRFLMDLLLLSILQSMNIIKDSRIVGFGFLMYNLTTCALHTFSVLQSRSLDFTQSMGSKVTASAGKLDLPRPLQSEVWASNSTKAVRRMDWALKKNRTFATTKTTDCVRIEFMPWMHSVSTIALLCQCS